MKKRLLCCLLSLVLLVTTIFSMAITAYATASEDTVVVVTANAATVRKAATNSGSRIATVYKDSEYPYIEETTASNGVVWYKIQYSSTKTGWLSSKYSEKKTVAVSTEPATAFTITIVNDAVPVLSEAGNAESKIGVAYADDKFLALDETTVNYVIYYQIQFTNDVVGWVKSGDTDKAQTTTTTPPVTEDTGKSVRIDTSVLNVRSGPGVGYSRVGLACKNSTYPYIESQTGSDGQTWYKIQFSDTAQGWVSSDYSSVVETGSSSTTTTTTTTTTAAPTTTAASPTTSTTSTTTTTTTTSTTATSTTQSTTTTTASTTAPTTTPTTTPTTPSKTYVAITGDGVNLRAGAGTSYSKVGTGYINAYYEYLGEGTDSDGKTWYKFQYNSSTVAWISSDYGAVTTTPPVTGISGIDDIASTYDVRSMQIALIDNGKVTDAYSYGWATKNTDQMTNDHKIRVASISKVITAMNMMRMQELGLVDLDEDISEYWGFTIKNPNYTSTPITLRHIFSHTSSIASLDYGDISSQLQSSSSFRSIKPGASSGWMYNNYAIGVGGATLELAADKTVNDFMNEQFLDGLGADASFAPGKITNKKYATLYYNDGSVARNVSTQANNYASDTPGSDTNAMYFAGGYTSSAQDLAKMIAVLANDGTYDGTRYLTADSVAEMETSLFTASENGGSFGQCLPMRYKANLYGESELYYHTGNAYGVLALASYNPETGDGVVVITLGASATRDSQGVYAACSEITEYCYKNLI